MTQRTWQIRAAACLLLACAGVPARAGSIYINGLPVGGGAVTVRPESFQERKFRTTVAQQHDFSCGSAALATLLTHTYGLPATEQEVFAGMFDNGDKAVISEQGFSLLDMKAYLARRGLTAEGYRAPLQKLIDIKVPAIVLVNVRGYNHFVVVEGVRDGLVLMSDPAVGIRTASVSEFQEQWGGIFFLILTGAGRVQQKYNAAEKWAVAPPAPNGLARYVVDLILLAQPAAARNSGRF